MRSGFEFSTNWADHNVTENVVPSQLLKPATCEVRLHTRKAFVHSLIAVGRMIINEARLERTNIWHLTRGGELWRP